MNTPDDTESRAIPVAPKTPRTSEEVRFGKLSHKERLGLERDKTYSEAELKTAFRKAVMEHHPDRGGSLYIIQDINEAYTSLKSREGREGEDGHEEKKVDPSFQILVDYIQRSESLEQLKRVFDMFDMYTEEQLRPLDLPTRIDKRALFIIGGMAAKALTKDDAKKVLAEITDDYRFFTSEARAAAVDMVEYYIDELPEGLVTPAKPEKKSDHAARKAFLKRVRETPTLLGLQRILEELNKNPDFDLNERRAIRKEITIKNNQLRGRK